MKDMIAYLVFTQTAVDAVYPALVPIRLRGLEGLFYITTTCPLRAAQPVVVVGDRNGGFSPQALYILDADHHPYQVSGARDLLLDGADLINLTNEMVTAYGRVETLLTALLHAFQFSSLQEYRGPLCCWERQVWERVANSEDESRTWKSCRQLVEDTIHTAQMDKGIKSQLLLALKRERAQGAQETEIEVNLEGYPQVLRAKPLHE